MVTYQRCDGQGQPSIQDETQIYLVIGNPGIGKSTLLNALTPEQPPFQSGVSYSSGMTQRLQMKIDKNNYFMDTPGLADADRVKARQAAEEITKSLKEDGRYHIFFVVYLDAGNVRSADNLMIQAVLQSAPIKQYSIIFNKVGKKIINALTEDDVIKDKVTTRLMAGCPVVTDRFFFVARDEDLADEDNVILPEDKIPSGLKDFIFAAPGMYIEKTDVTDIEVDQLISNIYPKARPKVGDCVTTLGKAATIASQ
jgi:GTP-binding protein EngB required for normal cell division